MSATPSPLTTADLDKLFEPLKTYNYGSGRGALMPLDDAVTNSLQNDAAKKELELRLAAVLKAPVPVMAKEYACRKLNLIGSAASVSALAGLLDHKELGDAARMALESMPDPEAAKALREALPKLNGAAKAGVINSLGERRDGGSLALLIPLLTDHDPQVTSAAAAALGRIGTKAAVEPLQQQFAKATDANRLVLADACLTCAERLLAAGAQAEAVRLYQSLAAGNAPNQVKLAATRGMMLAAQKK